MRTKFHDDQFRHVSDITVIAATIWGAVSLVMLIEGNYEYAIEMVYSCCIPNFIKTGTGVQMLLRFWVRGYIVGNWWKEYMNYAVNIGLDAIHDTYTEFHKGCFSFQS
jgi:hypothetical protein